MNITVDNITMDDLLQKFTSGFLVTPNVDHLVKLQKDRAFYDAYQEADYATVDSKILLWATYLLGTPAVEKVSGSDFFPAYCRHHAHDQDVRIFALGGKEGVARQAMESINQRCGREIVVGSHSPSMNFASGTAESEEVVDIINKSGANVLAVGLGAPKQEVWIRMNKEKFAGVHTFMALGATLDFEAGSVKRAPKWMSECGLEWFYRLLKEPGRMWRRYLVDDVYFFVLLLKQRLGLYRNPYGES